MLTSQYGILHTRALSLPGESPRIPVDRIERFGGRMILVHPDALAIRQRADPSDQRPRQLEPALAAMPPMDEHPESSFVEPQFHSRAFSPSSEALVYTRRFNETDSIRVLARVDRMKLRAARRKRQRRCLAMRD